jgi:hypothetical protein
MVLVMFSGITKTEVVYFTLRFLDNYRLKPYIIQVYKITKARMSLEGL